MWWIFPWGKIIFHTLSLIKGCEEKKRKCVENGHSKLEITRKIKKNYFSNLVYCGRKKGGLCNCLVSAKIVLLTKDLSVYTGYVKKCGKFYFVSKQKLFQRKTTRHWVFSILDCGISRHSMLHFSLKTSKSLLL
jgi:hypothetical protein